MSAAVELVRRFVDAYNAAAAGDRGRLGLVATPEAVAGYLVESHSGVVAPLASRTGVPEGASPEVDPARASEPFPGLVVVPFQGHGFPRPDTVPSTIRMGMTTKIRKPVVSRSRGRSG